MVNSEWTRTAFNSHFIFYTQYSIFITYSVIIFLTTLSISSALGLLK